MHVVGLFRSPEHVYFGHYGRSPGMAPMEALSQAQVETGRGIVGDRFHPPPEKGGERRGQITFFSEETWLRLCDVLGASGRGPGVFRRNVVVRGADLNALIGQEFEVQGLRFLGTEYCRPCFWMDTAFAPGAWRALESWNAGGLRARVLAGGNLTCSQL